MVIETAGGHIIGGGEFCEVVPAWKMFLGCLCRYIWAVIQKAALTLMALYPLEGERIDGALYIRRRTHCECIFLCRCYSIL